LAKVAKVKRRKIRLTRVPFHSCIRIHETYSTITLQFCKFVTLTQQYSQRRCQAHEQVWMKYHCSLSCSAKYNRILFHVTAIVQSYITHPVPFTCPSPLRLSSSTFHASPLSVFLSRTLRDFDIFSCPYRRAMFYLTPQSATSLYISPRPPPVYTSHEVVFTCEPMLPKLIFSQRTCKKWLLALSCLSVRPHGRKRLPNGFSWNVAFNKMGHIRSFWLKYNTNNTHFTWRPIYVYNIWPLLFYIIETVCFLHTERAEAEEIVRDRNNIWALSIVSLLLRYREILRRVLYKTTKATF
jgi:hypothetical protein